MGEPLNDAANLPAVAGARPKLQRRAAGEPIVGLALGSGSARGWAHIGVLRALLALGIEPQIVTGCSVGALVGAAWASGRLDALEAWVRGLDWWQMLNFVDLGPGALIAGERLRTACIEHIGEHDIETLPVHFGCVATDLARGREVWFQSGSLLDAVRASMALPGVFPPVRGEDGAWLVDGGLVDPVPVSLARALGAERVIAVNLNGDIVGRHLVRRRRRPAELLIEPVAARLSALFGREREAAPAAGNALQPAADDGQPGLFEVLFSAMNIMQDRITRSRMAGDPPDVLLAPRLAHLALVEFDRADEAIEIGRIAVEQHRAALLAAVGRPLPAGEP